MKASIAKLIFQVHRGFEPGATFEFDEQVIVLPAASQAQQVQEALNWAKAYEADNNQEPSEDFRWEFIGIRELIPFHVQEQVVPICSGSLFMEESESFMQHIKLKNAALENTFLLFS